MINMRLAHLDLVGPRCCLLLQAQRGARQQLALGITGGYGCVLSSISGVSVRLL